MNFKHSITSLICISLIACTTAHTSPSTKRIAEFYHLPNTQNLTLLPMIGYQQKEDYTCGAATAMTLMHYYGMLSTEQMNVNTELKISKEMGSTKSRGTSPQQLVTWLRHHGFTVEYGENGTVALLQNNLQKGIPTIVEWIDWGGHWDIVMGYDKESKTPDDDKDTLLFADPGAHWTNEKTVDGITTFNPDRFSYMWFDAQYFKPGHLVRGIYIVAVPHHNLKKPKTH